MGTKGKRFDPASDLAIVQKARATNAHRDREDRATGWATPGTSADMLARTALSALDCGLRIKDWNCVAEAYCMLQDLELSLRREE